MIGGALNNRARALLGPAFSLTIGVVGALAVAAWLGEDPLRILQLLVDGAVGTPTDRGYSLFYATPLALTGLSVAWAFRAGLFNIGAEGQMTLGGVAMAVVGITAPNLPTVVAVPLALSAGFVVGGAWGALAGWMKAKRGCHEVLATILLNFVAYGVAAYLILSVFKNPSSQVPETASVGASYRVGALPLIGGASPLNWTLFIALAAAVAYSVIFARLRFGFMQRLTGGAPGFAERAGVRLDREIIKAMFMSGGLAGVAGAAQILGFAGKAREGFANGAGFVGIAVALLGRGSGLGIILASIFFGMLAKGSLNLEIDADYVTRDLATVLEALVVLAIACEAGLARFLAKFSARLVKR